MNLINTRRGAIDSLTGNKALFSMVGDNITNWKSLDITQPSDAEIDAEVVRLEKEYSNNEYARKREVEYPSIQECVHAILDDDLVALQEKRQAVKTKYPKG